MVETPVSPELDLCLALDTEFSRALQSSLIRKIFCLSWRASLHFGQATLHREGLSLAGLELTGKPVAKTQRQPDFDCWRAELIRSWWCMWCPPVVGRAGAAEPSRCTAGLLTGAAALAAGRDQAPQEVGRKPPLLLVQGHFPEQYLI